MANVDVIKRMEVLLANVASDKIRATEFERSFEDYFKALEGTSQAVNSRARNLTARLVKARLAEGEDIVVESPQTVIEEIRQLMSELPRSGA